MAGAGNTNDHYVPRMYLKRFARLRAHEYQTVAAPADDLSLRFTPNIKKVAAESGFYWGTDTDGLPHHHLEDFLTDIESWAEPAFRKILNSGKSPSDDAYPRWPPPPATRLALSWWIAAQILRTDRQRTRLETTADKSVGLPDRYDRANRHIRYVAELVEPLVATIFFRPWGIGFSDYCLLTGDVPALVLNGQDHHDQQAATALWDVYLPLDPHRCLYLPGATAERRSATARDHRFKLHSGLSHALNGAVAEAAVRHVFFHPDHDPTPHLRPHRPASRAIPSSDLPRYVIRYEVLEPESGVERRWLDTHPEPKMPRENNAPEEGEDMQAVFNSMLEDLEKRQRDFDQQVPPSPTE